MVESKLRRKKSRGGSGFFQFAETVEAETFWEDPSLTRDLKVSRPGTPILDSSQYTDIPHRVAYRHLQVESSYLRSQNEK